MARSAPGARATRLTSCSFSKVAWAKAIVHSLHHASGSVLGLLVGNIDGGAASVIDCAPLFHTAVSSPISEVALSAVDAWATGKGYTIVGVYYADSVALPMRDAAERIALALGVRLAASEEPKDVYDEEEESRKIAKRTGLAMVPKDSLVQPIILARVIDSGIAPTGASGDKLADSASAAFQLSVVDKAGAAPRDFPKDKLVVEEGAGSRLLADAMGVGAVGPGGSEASRFRFADFDDHLADLSRAWTNDHIVA